jgi:hypothetical protein
MHQHGRNRSETSRSTNHIRTTRLDVAAFLLVQGLELLHVEGSNSTVTFVFCTSTDVSADPTLDFYRGATVVAKLYADAQKRIRDLLWEQRRR